MSEAPTKKYCIDCQHCFVPDNGRAYARCMKSVSPIYNDYFIAPEFDTAEKKITYCGTARTSVEQCGPEAAWFEPKA